MFIRPMGVTVRAANRPPGHPLLRGLLARASGAAEATAGSVGTAGPVAAAGPAGATGWTEPPARAQAEPPTGAPIEAPPEPPQPAEPEPEAAITPDHPAAAGLVAELTQLADLAREGLLTPQEFTTAKARLLRD
ncbi:MULTISPECIES: SHOCT domain-containing protein [Streptomyces]|uniref:SHOCT domain-containing protein n=1 Tax=Streptomyces virginiae TaxID=1961 RepID=A0ABZ1T959_STRVG|nr:SHOCT domain-containing protein [Streptomyces virginiae]WTB22545.1 SHOCT domain-containing protein [Streptomyces virginiae]